MLAVQITMCQTVFFLHIGIFLSSGRGSFLVLSVAGHAGGPRITLRCMCGPWPRSVARALGVQSRENWQVTTGRRSEHVEPSRRMQTHIVVVVFVFTLNRYFYRTTSAVPPVSFLILHPREIQILWSQTVRQTNQTSLKNQGRQIKC